MCKDQETVDGFVRLTRNFVPGNRSQKSPNSDSLGIPIYFQKRWNKHLTKVVSTDFPYKDGRVRIKEQREGSFENP